MLIRLLILSLLVDGGSAAAAALPLIPEHQQFQTSFTVSNPHDRAIRISSIDSSCTCNEIRLDEMFLLPRASTTLHFATDNAFLSGVQKHRVWLFIDNPAFSTLEYTVSWEVLPNISVDLVAAGSGGQRPEEMARRDVYAFTVWAKPDEIAERLSARGADSKRLLLSSPASSRPDAQPLEILDVDYAGEIWDFTWKRLDDDSFLLLAHAADSIGKVAAGTYSETAVVRTNHPHKPSITLTLHTALDPQAGSAGSGNPWSHLR